jgi:hypothetical protein
MVILLSAEFMRALRDRAEERNTVRREKWEVE